MLGAVPHRLEGRDAVAAGEGWVGGLAGLLGRVMLGRLVGHAHDENDCASNGESGDRDDDVKQGHVWLLPEIP